MICIYVIICYMLTCIIILVRMFDSFINGSNICKLCINKDSCQPKLGPHYWGQEWWNIKIVFFMIEIYRLIGSIVNIICIRKWMLSWIFVFIPRNLEINYTTTFSVNTSEHNTIIQCMNWLINEWLSCEYNVNMT